ncbi:MAG: hypothetical protein V4772_10565 [Pseudomonadota bacterium]
MADTISISSVKRRVRVVGADLEQAVGQIAQAHPDLQGRTILAPPNRPSALTALAVDSGWLRHSDPPRHQARHVNLVAGRACFEGGNTRLYAYVHNQVPSAATRLDRFLTESGVGPNQRVTVLTDGAGEFEKAVNGTSRPTCRILDWFHIAMKLRAIEQTALKYPDMVAPNGRSLHDEIASCKWLVWHGKAAKAVTRLRGIHDVLEETPVLRDSALY